MRLKKKLPFRELSIPVKMLRGRMANRKRHITPFKPATVDHGELTLHENGVPVVHVHGTSHEMGRALGELVGQQASETYLYYMRHFTPDLKGDMKLAHEMESLMPDWFIEEMKGFAETSPLTYDEVLLGQTFLDIHKVALCSTICAHDKASKTGEILLGRNLDFPALSIAHEANYVVAYHPSDRPAYTGVTWPGFLGIITGMNTDGLALSMMLVYGHSRKEHLDGQPFPLVFRRLLREHKNVKSSVDWLETRPYCTATNLILADKNRTAARLQLHPQNPVTEYTTPEQPFTYCTNHYMAKKIKAFAFTWFSSKARINRLKSAVRRGPLDVQAVKDALQATGMPGINLQRIVMRPETLEMQVAFDDLGRGHGRWATLPSDILFPEPATVGA